MQQQTETTFEENKNKFNCWLHFVRGSYVFTCVRLSVCHSTALLKNSRSNLCEILWNGWT